MGHGCRTRIGKLLLHCRAVAGNPSFKNNNVKENPESLCGRFD